MILKTYQYNDRVITWEKNAASVAVSNGMFAMESFGFYVDCVKYLTLNDAKSAIDKTIPTDCDLKVI